MPNIPFPGDLPFSIQGVRDEFDRLLDRVWHGGLSTAPLDGQDWAPAIDMSDAPDAYHLRVEVPGLSAEDVEVSILSNVLVVKGCKKEPGDPGGKDRRRLRSECRYGSFCRRIELTSGVNEEGIRASCRNGVLELVLPKKAEPQGRTVPVSGG